MWCILITSSNLLFLQILLMCHLSSLLVFVNFFFVFSLISKNSLLFSNFTMLKTDLNWKVLNLDSTVAKAFSNWQILTFRDLIIEFCSTIVTSFSWSYSLWSILHDFKLSFIFSISNLDESFFEAFEFFILISSCSSLRKCFQSEPSISFFGQSRSCVDRLRRCSSVAVGNGVYWCLLPISQLVFQAEHSSHLSFVPGVSDE